MPVRRAWWLYAAVVLVMGVFGVRAFYLQVIKHDHYVKAAAASQLKEYAIEPTRGIIKAHEGENIVPIVLNEKRYTLFGDPALVDNPEQAARDIAAVIGGSADEYKEQLATPDTRYVVLARKLTDEQREAILRHKHPGIGAQQQYQRVYPNGSLASQLLGFVNNAGDGVYGIEQALDEQLRGTPGLLKAITDVNGVPLPANSENTRIPAVPGDDVVLTIDLAMQQRLEQILKEKLEQSRSDSGSALILDPNTGAVKAMANWPTFDPRHFAQTEDAARFNNAAVSLPFEVGSIMKPLTAAAALDLGRVERDTTYDDPGEWEIDGYPIRNVEEVRGAGRFSLQDILRLSMNTGATWLLMQMGSDPREVTQEARENLHRYFTEHYQFGQPTGIEQGVEAEGYVPDPNEGYGLNLKYANMSFGQGMTATILQMAAAFSAVVNDGVYYQPHLVDRTIDADGKAHIKEPNVVRRGVVSKETSADMRSLLEGVVRNRSAYLAAGFNHDLYSVGGKTGTAEIASPEGGYYTDRYNGTYIGFVGGDRPEYVIVVRANNPKVGGYAGTVGGEPIFVELARMLVEDFNVTPRGQ
jgi:cell division protein FtsI/penicillin-binding protein 2